MAFGTVPFREAIEVPQGKSAVQVVESLSIAQPQRTGKAFFGLMKTKQSCTSTLQIAYRFNRPQAKHCTKGTYVVATRDSEIGAGTLRIRHATYPSLFIVQNSVIAEFDIDVVDLSIAMFPDLHINELWVACGVKKHYRYIAIHTIANKLGRENSRALPFFHAITACDAMSFLSSVAKKTAWEVRKAFPEFTKSFIDLGNLPLSLSEETMKHLQRFVILLYDKTSQITQVDHCSRKGKANVL